MLLDNFSRLYEMPFSIDYIGAGSLKFFPGNRNDYRKCGRENNIIHIVTSGERSYRIGSRFEKCGAGTVLFIPSGCKYLTYNTVECSGIGIYFTFNEDIQIAENVYLDWFDEHGDYLKLFKNLDESMLSNPKAHLHHRSILYRILDMMTRESSEGGKYADLISPAVAMIKSRYRENLPICEYAAACRISESYFRTVFSRQMGMTAIEYRNRFRFEEALKLRHGGMSMAEIAESLGFCDATYMRKLFRRFTGKSLSEATETEFV